MQFVVLVLLLLLAATGEAAAARRPIESFSESLLVRRVDSNNIGLRFEFVHRKQQHHNLNHTSSTAQPPPRQSETFPKLVDDIFFSSSSNNVSDVRLVLARGKWRWGGGETMWPSVESGSSGGELMARMTNPEADWPVLVRALAGLTCSSLDAVDYAHVGRRLHSHDNSSTVFAHLPSETVCVENLAPFLKLLPGRHVAGLGRAIAPKHLLSTARYYAMALTMRCSGGRLELVQSLSVVLPMKKHLADALPGWRGMAPCGGAGGGGSVLLLDGATRDSSRVLDLYSAEASSVRLDELPVYNNNNNNEKAEGVVQVDKWQTGGQGSLRGKMSVLITCPIGGLVLSHWEYLPHFIQPRMRTLRVSTLTNQTELRSAVSFSSGDATLGTPGYLHFSLVCPSTTGSSISITYTFDKMFLLYAQYPPNPNRGFDVPASVTHFNRSSSCATAATTPVWARTHCGPVRVASDALLVYLAHPDFSMPYNVITLSSTAFAMFLGMLVNIGVRERGDRWSLRSRQGGLAARARVWVMKRRNT